MTNPKGKRRATRYLFSRQFRHKGVTELSRYLKIYKVGDFVDIRGDGAIQKGMPHKCYHGNTGKVFNVTPHALGVVVNKRVRGKVLPKRINIRVEHVRPSRCREDFLRRVKANEVAKRNAKAAGIKIHTKRVPPQPREAHFVKTKKNLPQMITPIPYEFIA